MRDEKKKMEEEAEKKRLEEDAKKKRLEEKEAEIERYIKLGHAEHECAKRKLKVASTKKSSGLGKEILVINPCMCLLSLGYFDY